MSGGISQSYLYLGVVFIPVSRRGGGGVLIPMSRGISVAPVSGSIFQTCVEEGRDISHTNVWRYFSVIPVSGGTSYTCVEEEGGIFFIPMFGGISIAPVSGGISHTGVEEG